MTQKRRVRLTLAACFAALLAMTGLVAAAKPLYESFCRATGYGGTTQRAFAAPNQQASETLEVRFDTNVGGGAPLQFSPVERSMRLRFGEIGTAFFKVKNLSDRPITAVATYNVAPDLTGIYFQKLECFCFTEHVFPPGQEVELPVVFFVRPELLENRDVRDVRSITLSYTYFEKAAA